MHALSRSRMSEGGKTTGSECGGGGVGEAKSAHVHMKKRVRYMQKQMLHAGGGAGGGVGGAAGKATGRNRQVTPAGILKQSSYASSSSTADLERFSYSGILKL